MEMAWARGWGFTGSEINSDSKDFEVCHSASDSTQGCPHSWRDEVVGEVGTECQKPFQAEFHHQKGSLAWAAEPGRVHQQCSLRRGMLQRFSTKSSKGGQQTGRWRKGWRELGENIQGDLRTTLLFLGLDREQGRFGHPGHLKVQQVEMQEELAKRNPLSLFIKRRIKWTVLPPFQGTVASISPVLVLGRGVAYLNKGTKTSLHQSCSVTVKEAVWHEKHWLHMASTGLKCAAGL